MANSDETAGIERGGFLVFLALITLALIVIVWPFAAPILWASLAAIMFQPLYRKALSFSPTSPNRAAISTLGVIFFAVLMPALLIGSAVLQEATSLFIAFQEGQIDVAAWFTQIYGALPAQLQSVLAEYGIGDFEALQGRAQEFAAESMGVIAQQAVAIGGSAFGFVLSLGIGLYVAYFLIRDGQTVGTKIKRGLPVSAEIADRLVERFLLIVRATIKGSIMVGLVQGALGAITFWIVGVPSAMLFGLLMAIFSLLPALGPAIVWLPVAIYLLATGAMWQGILVIGSGVLVIGMADNLLRPILVGRDTGIPDWIILVTTLGGIATIGLSGIVLGPMAAGLFLAGWGIAQEQRNAAAA